MVINRGSQVFWRKRARQWFRSVVKSSPQGLGDYAQNLGTAPTLNLVTVESNARFFRKETDKTKRYEAVVEDKARRRGLKICFMGFL